MKLVWMVLFALPLMTMTACGDDDDLVDDNTGATVELKDYSDLIGKKYSEAIEKMGPNYDQDETDQWEIVYYNIDPNVVELDICFTFYEDDEVAPYEKAVMVDVDVVGFSNSYLLNRLQKLYGEATTNQDEDGELYYTYEKSGKYILFEYYKEYNEGQITYFDKKEFDKVFGSTKAGANSLKAVRDNAKAARK